MPSFREIGIGLVLAGLGGVVVGFFVSNRAGLLAVVGLGSVLILFDAAWWRWQRPKWIARQLDEACRYIIRSRLEAESKARLDDRNSVLGPFGPPPPFAGGKYGPFSNADARKGFERLRELGVIERESYDTETATERYCWTKLGEGVAARL